MCGPAVAKTKFPLSQFSLFTAHSKDLNNTGFKYQMSKYFMSKASIFYLEKIKCKPFILWNVFCSRNVRICNVRICNVPLCDERTLHSFLQAREARCTRVAETVAETVERRLAKAVRCMPHAKLVILGMKNVVVVSADLSLFLKISSGFYYLLSLILS